MVAQAFFYNAIFFTYAMTLERFYAVPAERVGAYLLPFALGNFLGYALGSALMLAAALAALALGVAAERRPLEEIARPLSLAGSDE